MHRELFNRLLHKARRRELRADMPSAERQLWTVLQKRRCAGAKFRRQQGIGPYIVDFYCASHRLVIEVDGDSHMISSTIIYDLRRDQYMRSKGIRTLRFSNEQVYFDMEFVLERIRGEIGNNPL